MPEKTDNLVRVDKLRLVRMGQSVYVLLPKCLRQDGEVNVNTIDQYKAVFYRPVGENPDTIIRIEKIEDKKDA